MTYENVSLTYIDLSLHRPLRSDLHGNQCLTMSPRAYGNGLEVENRDLKLDFQYTTRAQYTSYYKKRVLFGWLFNGLQGQIQTCSVFYKWKLITKVVIIFLWSVPHRTKFYIKL